jgi:hypothetical protein
MLESGKMPTGMNVPESTTHETIVRLKACVGELNKLLKEYSNIPRA